MAEVVKKQTAEIAVLDQSMLEADSGLGNKEVDQETLSIPFLKTNLSKQILEANRGAVSGDMYNTVTGEIYDRDKGIKVVPCVFQRRFIQWSPLGDEQSAPIAIYATKEECPTTERSKEDNKEYLTDGSGHYIEDTHQHYCLIVKTDDKGNYTGATDAVMIAMKSTSLKASRKWNSIISTRRKQKADGSMFIPPRFLYMYNLGTYMESGRKGDYFVWDMKLDNELSDVNLYNEAKAFALSVEQNTVEVKYEQDSGKETETPKTQPTNSVKPETEDKSNQDEMPF
tara:strand:- start:89 stop:940 length:852 start_codon:yes stop_codon:yes gene_type:complete